MVTVEPNKIIVGGPNENTGRKSILQKIFLAMQKTFFFSSLTDLRKKLLPHLATVFSYHSIDHLKKWSKK